MKLAKIVFSFTLLLMSFFSKSGIDNNIPVIDIKMHIPIAAIQLVLLVPGYLPHLVDIILQEVTPQILELFNPPLNELGTQNMIEGARVIVREQVENLMQQYSESMK